MTGISQLKFQWQREAREDERKLIADCLDRYFGGQGSIKSVSDQVLIDAIRNGSYKDKP